MDTTLARVPDAHGFTSRPMLRLRLLGGLSLERPGAPIVGAAIQRSRLALLAAIAVTGGTGISRDRLLAIFWPDSDTARARGALKQAIYAIRRDLGEPEVILGVELLRLNPAVITCDVDEFLASWQRDEWSQAVTLYGGPLLDGVHLPSREFSLWREAQEQRFAGRYADALEQLTKTAERNGDVASAIHWWKARATADPLSTTVTLSLMRALEAAGDIPSALKHAAIHSQLVRADLETEPDEQVTRLGDELRARQRQPARLPTPAVTHEPLTEIAESRAQPGDIAVGDAVGTAWPAVESPHRRRFHMSPAGMALLALTGLAAAGFVTVFGATASQYAPDQLEVVGPLSDKGGNNVPLAEQITTQVVRRVPLQVAHTRWPQQPEFTVTLVLRPVGDSVDLSATVSRDGHTIQTIGPMRSHSLRLMERVPIMGERLAVAIAAQRSPVLQTWAAQAALPHSWRGFRALELALSQWRPRAEVDTTLARLDTVAGFDTTAATPLILQAVMLAKFRRVAGAESLVTQLERSPRRTGAWDLAMLNMIRAMIRQDWSAGHAASHQLMGVAPRSEWALFAAVHTLNVGRPQEALRWLDQMPDSVEWPQHWRRVVRNQAWIASGDYAAALKEAQYYLQREPEDFFFQQVTAKALAGLGRYEEVEAQCQQSLLQRLHMQPCIQGVQEVRGYGATSVAQRMARHYVQAVQASDTVTPGSLRDTQVMLADYSGNWNEVERVLRGVPLSQMNMWERISWAKARAARGDRPGADDALRTVTLDGQNGTMVRAEIAALSGDQPAAVALVGEAFRNGYERAFSFRLFSGLDGLRGFAPFESLVKPVDETAHLATITATRPLNR